MRRSFLEKTIKENKQQQVTIEHYAALRKELKSVGDYIGLPKLPCNASPTRLRNRDAVDGRLRGYMLKFSVSIITFRSLAHEGKIPGVKKASW